MPPDPAEHENLKKCLHVVILKDGDRAGGETIVQNWILFCIGRGNNVSIIKSKF